MLSDMRKHPETRDHVALELGNQLYAVGLLSTAYDMKHFILGFN